MTDLLTALLAGFVIVAIALGWSGLAAGILRAIHAHHPDTCPGCRARDDRPMQP